MINQKFISKTGLILGPLLLLLFSLLPVPACMTELSFRMVGIVLLVAVLWLTEALDAGVTALLPLILLPLFGITSTSKAAGAYINTSVFLFMGGFMIALAMEYSGLHIRIAMTALKKIGTRPRNVILAIMLVTWFLSMWMSNTATVLMLVPTCMAIASGITENSSKTFLNPLLLGTAYAASLGGMATFVGSAPCGMFAAMAEQNPSMSTNFFQWMIFCVPITFIMLILCWFLLVRFLYPVWNDTESLSSEYVDRQLALIGNMKKHEARVLMIFIFVAILWLVRGLIDSSLNAKVSDASIAIAGAIAMFIVPDGKGGKLLTWDVAKKLPWDVLILFGGGLCLSMGVTDSGLGRDISVAFTSMENISPFLFMLIVVTVVVFMTEFMSNTATATLLIPIMFAVANGMGINPRVLVLPVTLATGMAFMLPVATPPNAIVFGMKRLSIREMCKAGLIMNIISIIVITLASYFILPSVNW